MNISQAMWDKAQAVIAADCFDAWKAANVLPSGLPRKKHRPYAVPQRADDLVKALGRDDAETVATILMYRGGPD